MNNSERKTNIIAVVPFFNESDFIRDIVSATLNFTDIIIAVDDGSTDNSAERIKDLRNVIIIKN